ncbi:DctP family TRAP transporter solute-binding subunit [Eubacterium sp. F2]|jgi:tripartite ATP-independent transporter DctP family solute receptor|uniref:DctP family TRAP transporter solute-binding subunit n=1 Tax=Eubacterium sp. F2 TaxID=3381348 RepID=UPI0039082FCE
MKKKIIAAAMAIVVAAAMLTGCGSSSSSQNSSSNRSGKYKKMELVMAVNGTDNQIDSKVAEKFADLVSKKSGGQVTISVFPNDQLAGGNATKGIEMVAGGSVDLAAYATSTLSVIDEKLSVGTIPWSFDTYGQAAKTIDSKGYKYYSKRLSRKGLTYLSSFHNGFRQLTNSKREVAKPSDLKGLKIRVPGSQVYMGVFKTLHADPVAMSWSEVFTAIQQGTIDGQENGISITSSAKMDEVQKYMTLWRYAYDSDLIIANTKVWKSLDPNTRKLLSSCSEEASEWGRKELVKEESQLLTKFEKNGMKVTKLSDSQMDAFKKSVNSFRNQMIDFYGPEACKAFNIKKR